ncbi:hypothetical protein ALC57_15375 [Trachymyrmex cornetzi]|uniref:Uncharacterized protein n=1 Tax=Trachymyrmex cornetzi TaxID=471704 RepID=A0A195DIK0_9HYME|nr:hypothetical protein ALC57_15375 [Trachymyrmex cornetzi]
MEFTKPEDPEQRTADPWIKKMQEISRQEREKWATYRRNVKLTLDDVEETTKAGKLTNDESIPMSMFSKSEKYENIERSKLPIKLFKKNKTLEANIDLDPTTSKSFVRHPLMDQNSADVKDSSNNRFHYSSWPNSKQSAATNIDEASNKNLKSDERNTQMKNLSKKFLWKAIHQRHKDYEISDMKRDPSLRNSSIDYEKNKLEEDRPSSIINLYPKESISQQLKDSHILKSNIKTKRNLDHKIDSKLFSQNDKEINENSKKDNEKTIIAKSLVWKIKEKKDDAKGKDVTEKRNHEKSFHSDRWGMSHLSSPPIEFLKDIPRRSKHQKNKEQTKTDENHYMFGRWGMSVVLPPKDFLEDISMDRGHGTERFSTKRGSRLNEIKGSSNGRPLIHQNRRNSETALVQKLMTNKPYKKFAGTLSEKVPNNFDYSRYSSPNYWSNYPNADINNRLFLRFLQALRSYIWQDDIDTPMLCRIRIPYASFRI